MHGDIQVRASLASYSATQAKFVSEFGHIGPARYTSMKRYLDGDTVEPGNAAWKEHTNRFELDTVMAGIQRHYLDEDKVTLADYLLFGGLVQGMVLEYSLDSFRSREDCWGSLIWDYNDSWGEIGWSIIDYYQQRKIAYYFVKRAFAPIRLVIRSSDGQVNVIGVNATAVPQTMEFEYGCLALNGAWSDMQHTRVELPPFNRGIIASCTPTDRDRTEVVYATRPLDGYSNILPAILLTADIRQLALPDATLRMEELDREQDTVTLAISADGFAHAVHFALPDEALPSDNYFNLLPGERRIITIKYPANHAQLPPIQVLAVGGLHRKLRSMKSTV